MDKLHERKMNDSYKSPNDKCLEKFEFVKKFELVECRNSRKIDGKSMNVPNREVLHKMYRQSRLAKKFDFVESTVNMMCREKILLMQKQILSMQKNIFDYCEIQT